MLSLSLLGRWFLVAVAACSALTYACGWDEAALADRGVAGEGAGEGGEAGVVGGNGGSSGAGAGGGGASGGAGSGAEGGGGSSGASGAAGEGASGGSGGDGGSSGSAGSGATGGSGGDELVFVEEPKLEMSADANTPLYGELTLSTNRKTTVRVTTQVSGRSWEHEFAGLATEHVHTLLRFIPNTPHQLTVSVTDELGETLTYAEELSVTAPALPPEFPELSVPISIPAEREPGVILACVQTVAPPWGGHLILFDELGEIVWWHYDGSHAPGDLRRLPNGNLFWVSRTRRYIKELDMRGRVVRSFLSRGPVSGSNAAPPADAPEGQVEPIVVPTDFFHHEAAVLESGNILTLTSELRSFSDYPTSETNSTPRTEPVDLVGESVLEFTPGGGIVGRWSFLDLFDPYRVAWGSFGNSWEVYYNDLPVLDWGHANSVIVDPKDGQFIVSLRNQDTIAKFDRAGQLTWILADHANWSAAHAPYLLTPTGDGFAWHYHQHAPELTKQRTLLVFDNGGRRASPPAPGVPNTERHSRVVEFRIDEAKREVSTVWQYGSAEPGPDHYYAPAMGDADELPSTGNVLVTIGTVPDPVAGEPSAFVREVTRTVPAKVVFELRVEGDNPGASAQRMIYRAENLDDVYPE